jgi:hypothetical protein
MIRMVLSDNVAAGLGVQRTRLHAALVQGVTKAAIGVQADVVANYLHGQVLHQRTGNLARNIIGPKQGAPVTDAGTEITGTVGIGSTAWYGKLHEFGGVFTVPGYEAHRHKDSWLTRMTGKSRRVRRFSQQGYWEVQSHQVNFPVRSFIRASLTANMANGRIRAWVEGPMMEALK